MIGSVFAELYKAYGNQHWWPADSAFEVMVGAILVQNTNWSNVEKAIAQLKQQQALDPDVIVAATNEELGEWIRSSGFYKVKAQRLKAYCQWYLEQGGFDGLNQFRNHLLIGAEALASNNTEAKASAPEDYSFGIWV